MKVLDDGTIWLKVSRWSGSHNRFLCRPQDGVAQAGHELHIPLAEPGVCGLAVDEQLEASGTVRVALQADLRIREDVYKRQSLT